ncbi:hypothetical protein KGQ20_02105 [Catenulispora sp. NF23]|uniref:Uncharacterized protein n=1 Tax=Catenulispora pinistramenti TaxID=2705254 RepID=A0ABS5KIH9_9ACTN|nr:hypothetical protein [Catenulispora pinistramenti]MBS2531558.1 hypothetical protein [Catenulispora pinistramenti]MBS2546192.1 hypothetical protein [Catenulispora pinistramenti]
MPDMVNVRKAHAGADSAGHTWPSDGAVIEVPVEHALMLARIPDGGFVIVEGADDAASDAGSDMLDKESTKSASTRRKTS